LLDGTAITAIRTGAGSALATRLLSREDATTLAILGTGVQARAHARTVTRVRRFERIRVAGRSDDKAAALATELAGELDLQVTSADSYEEACTGADVICATTHSPEPVVRRDWLPAGAHVNSVGYNTEGREVDGATVADALVVVESRQAALAPPPAGSNDLQGARDVVEIGELVAGTKPGRSSADQITLYKSVGVAVQDGVAASLALHAARERGAGTEVDL
jgi:ornithine cyclodeaminase/alanine dehydrogenase-like protein (mu-crystallin family)